MWKKVGIALGAIAWIAGTLGFFLQLRTSGLSEWAQSAIFVGWISVALLIISFMIGREWGIKRNSNFNGKNSSMGIIRSFRRRELDNIMPINQSIMNASSDILFIGLSLPKLDNSTGLLEKKALDGVRIRLLVPDPCEKSLILTISRFLEREATYARELSWFFNNFLPIWEKSPNHFEVRVHNYMPTVTASIFDCKEGSIEIYMFGWKTDERFMLALDFGGLAKDCRANLEKLWDASTPLTSKADFKKRISAAEQLSTILSRKSSSKLL